MIHNTYVVDILPKETINQPAGSPGAEAPKEKLKFGASMKANLKLPQLRQIGRGFEDARWPVITSIIILCLVVLTWAGFFFYYKSLEKQKANLNNRAAELNIKENQDMTRNILDLEKDLKKTKKLLDSHVYASRALKLLEDNTLSNAQLLDFNLDVKSGLISAGGLAQTYAVLAKQILLLEKQDSIKSVKVSKVSLDQLGGVGFSIEINLKENFFNKK